MGATERKPTEEHFTEGEPDLEPPEEFALSELDDETILEEELDNEDLLEQDVDEDVLEVTLEDLVHSGDDNGPDAEATEIPHSGNGAHPAEEEVEEEDDVEEALDQILYERLALFDLDGTVKEDEVGEITDTLLPLRVNMDGDRVAPCGPDEFVCCSCFLVFRRVQLANATASLCRDCSR